MCVCVCAHACVGVGGGECLHVCVFVCVVGGGGEINKDTLSG